VDSIGEMGDRFVRGEVHVKGMAIWCLMIASVGARAADGCGSWLDAGPDARAVVANLEADWTLADEALDLVSSITRGMHAMDDALGRTPQGPGAVAERAEFSAVLIRREWEHLHSLSSALIAMCLLEASEGPRAPANLREALAHAHLDFESYLRLPSIQARLTGRWTER
jgi:hypothetical protein